MFGVLRCKGRAGWAMLDVVQSPCCVRLLTHLAGIQVGEVKIHVFSPLSFIQTLASGDTSLSQHRNYYWEGRCRDVRDRNSMAHFVVYMYMSDVENPGVEDGCLR